MNTINDDSGSPHWSRRPTDEARVAGYNLDVSHHRDKLSSKQKIANAIFNNTPPAPKGVRYLP